jgi:bacillithiol synthase
MHCIVADNDLLGQYYPKAVFDYLQKSDTLTPFYQYYPNLEGYAEKIKSRTFSAESRKVLHKALTNQYDGLLTKAGSEAVKNNINALLDDNTYTITTGQQIHIYLGPLYVTYKILTTIAQCRWLEQNIPGSKYVPVFWMATEDHDFEEIKHLPLYNRDFNWIQPEGYTGAVGRINPATINELEAEIAPLLQNDEEATKLLALFTEAYKTHTNFAAATRDVLHTLFAHTGLVIIDADDKDLKIPFIPFIKNDIFKQQNFEVVNATTQKFEADFKAQIRPREINFFYLTPTGRHRIVAEDGKYKVLDTDIEFDEISLNSEIDKHPENFSPNVIMRPLYQEVILPNLAYVGGPAEVNYWMQLRDMFVVNNVQFPVLELRKSLIVLNQKTVDKIAEMGFTPIDFLMEEEEIAARYLKKNVTEAPDFKANYDKVAAELETIKQEALKLDANLKPFLEGEFKRITDTFEKLDNKLEKVGKRAFEGQLKQIETIKTKFFKPGAWAERSDTLLSLPLMSNPQVVNQLLKTFNQQNKPLIIVLPPLI